MTVGKGPLSSLSRASIALVVIEIACAATLAVTGSAGDRNRQEAREVNRLVVRELGLTDLALSTGTSYTRHPTQADLFAAHGEHPCAIEHFPAGSVVPPPADQLGLPPHGVTRSLP